MLEFLDNIFPLVVIYLIWRKFTRVKKEVKDRPEPVEAMPQTEQPVHAQSAEAKKVTVNPLEVLRQIMGGVLDVPSQDVLDGKRTPATEYEEESFGEWQPQWDNESPAEAEPTPELVPVKQAVAPPHYTAGVFEPKRKHKPESRPRAVKVPGSFSAQARKKSKRLLVGCSRKKLQEAVIWAEVLGKPVALRDQ